jgi:sugar O-acyltransferase (sialic acid O-acetyltransferase NeuD family)
VSARRILLFGAGGHSSVVREIVRAAGNYEIVAVIDRSNEDASGSFGVQAGIVAIGDNFARSRVVARVRELLPDFQFVTAVHPAAVIAEGVEVGPGTVVMPGVCISPGTRIGAHCIVNTGATLDHDDTLGDFASVAPGVTAGGNVSVGAFSAVGLGASLIHGISIGDHSVIGAGAVVVRNVPAHVVAYGNPSRVVRAREAGAPYL